MIEATADGGALRLINQVDVETYLVGMGEVRNPSWPLASLEAQEVAARTYALRAMAAGGELCDDTRCQVYLGTDAEYPAAQQAVTGSAGEVLMAGGSLADAVYSANAAGYSASPVEGFGTNGAGFPYLRPAPYPTSDPMRWTVRISTADVAAKFGLHGPLTNIAVTQKGPSGRAMVVTLTSGTTSTSVSGLTFAAGLGLRSTMIDAIRPEVAAVAPPPPTASILQVPPDMAAAIAAPTVTPAPADSPVVAGAPTPAFVAGPRAVRRTTEGVPVALILLALAMLAVTGAAALRASRVVERR